MTLKHTKSIEDVGSWTFEVATNSFYFDEKCAEYFGLQEKELGYETFLDQFDSENRFFLHNHFQQLIKHNIPFVLECVIGSNELEKAIRLSGSACEFRDGQVIKLSGIIRLYTNDLNSKFRQGLVLNILDDLAIISISNTKGEIIYANKLFCEVSGYEKEELLGKTHSIVKSGMHPNEFYKKMWQTICEGRVWHGEVINKKKNGELYYVEAHIYPVLNFKQEIIEFIAVRFDITEQKMREQDELVRAKFQMMGETSAQIMHDVMNPLTIIQMSLDMLDYKVKKGLSVSHEELDKKVSSMRDSTLRIRTIFSNMKDLLANKNETQEMDIYDCVHKAIEISSLRLGKNKIVTEVHFQVGQYEVEFNFQQLLQVLINLTNNSIDAIDELQEKWIKFTVVEHESFFILSITDSGHGIDPSLHKKIFQSLFTTKDKEKGTGLGLPICKRIMENYGGKIEINSHSTNTQFDIYLQKKLTLIKAA